MIDSVCYNEEIKILFHKFGIFPFRRSFVEPVNTLKTRMETKPLYNDKWLDELNESYSSISRNRAEVLRKEKES